MDTVFPALDPRILRLDILRMLLPNDDIEHCITNADRLATFVEFGIQPVWTPEAAPIDIQPPSPDTLIVHDFDADGRMIPPGGTVQNNATGSTSLAAAILAYADTQITDPAVGVPATGTDPADNVIPPPNSPPVAGMLDPETMQGVQRPPFAQQTSVDPVVDESETAPIPPPMTIAEADAAMAAAGTTPAPDTTVQPPAPPPDHQS